MKIYDSYVEKNRRIDFKVLYSLMKEINGTESTLFMKNKPTGKSREGERKR